MKSQNLVPNPGFEELSGLGFPRGIGQLDHTKDWKSPNRGTTDYFYAGVSKKYIAVQVPFNFAGYQQAHGGSGYAGIISYGGVGDYREYLMIELLEKLEKGQTYCLRFHYSLGNFSRLQVRSMGAVFTHKKIEKQKLGDPLQGASLNLPIKNDTGSWHEFSAHYVAKGKEHFLTIGSFANDARKVKLQPQPKQFHKFISATYTFAYYYIDDVSLVEVKDSASCGCNEPDPVLVLQIVKPDSFQQKEIPEPPVTKKDSVFSPQNTYAFRELFFETSKYVIRSSSFPELNRLAGFLLQNSKYTIEIAGHTDNTGKESDNHILSEARAKAVADYLAGRGVDATRIISKGYGSDRPLQPNDSDEHKQMNRRVEFLLKE